MWINSKNLKFSHVTPNLPPQPKPGLKKRNTNESSNCLSSSNLHDVSISYLSIKYKKYRNCGLIIKEKGEGPKDKHALWGSYGVKQVGQDQTTWRVEQRTYSKIECLASLQPCIWVYIMLVALLLLLG